MTTSASSEPHRYLFVHIMKTGGTALVRRLRERFGDAVYPTPGLDGTDLWELYLLPDRLREQLAARGDEIEIIAGHFPLCTTELIDGRVTTLTLLREPIERVLSSLRSARRASLEQAFDEFADRTLPAMKWHPALDPDNNMTRMLSVSSEEMRSSSVRRTELSRVHLERAKEALTRMGAVGVQEDFDDFCAELTARFGWNLGEPVTINVSPRVEASEGLRARIAEDNALDVELYEFATKLVPGSTS